MPLRELSYYTFPHTVQKCVQIPLSICLFVAFNAVRGKGSLTLLCVFPFHPDRSQQMDSGSALSFYLQERKNFLAAAVTCLLVT